MSKARTKNGQQNSKNVSGGDNINFLQIENSAIKFKNKQLVDEVTKMKQEIAEYSNKVLNLQAENLILCAKYNRVDRILKSLNHQSRLCMPRIIDLLNVILEVTENTENSPLGPSISSKVNINGGSPAKTTHTVKPHTVNGTVLLRPTISLTRLGINQDDSQPSTSNSLNNASGISCEYYRPDLSQENVGESSGTSMNSPQINGNANEDDEENDFDENPENAEHSFVSKRFRRRYDVPKSHDYSESETEEEEVDENQELEEEQYRDTEILDCNSTITTVMETEEEEVDENQEVEEEQYRKPLSTINETGEITIMLERINESEMNSFFNKSKSSSRNVTRKLSELDENSQHVELRTSKRLKVDETLFEPTINSTSNNLLLTPQPSPLPNMSRLKMTPTEESMDTEVQNSLDSAPSTSTMYDFDSKQLKLSILEGETADSLNHSSPSQTRSSTMKKIAKRKSQGSPTVVFSSRLMDSLICTRRGGSRSSLVMENCSPVVLLERMEELSPQPLSRMEAKVPKRISKTTALKKNSKLSSNRKPSRSGSRSASERSNKKSSENKSVQSEDENNDENDEGLHEKIEEIQRRLSVYNPTPSVSETEDDSTKSRSQRPSRAAKPKNLKDASLRTKMRR